MQEIPPLDLTEILANLVRQSEPFLDQLGVRRGTDKNHKACTCILFSSIYQVLTLLYVHTVAQINVTG